MRLIDADEAVLAAIKAAGIEAHITALDAFTGNEGVVVQALPATVTSTDFDGTQHLGAKVQIIARYFGRDKAREAVERIVSLLDGIPLPSPSGRYTWEETEIYTWPQRMDDSKYDTWEVKINVQIARERR